MVTVRPPVVVVQVTVKITSTTPPSGTVAVRGLFPPTLQLAAAPVNCT